VNNNAARNPSSSCSGTQELDVQCLSQGCEVRRQSEALTGGAKANELEHYAYLQYLFTALLKESTWDIKTVSGQPQHASEHALPNEHGCGLALTA